MSYVACFAEETALGSGSIDLITVAQAFHWFDHARFYREAGRVLAPAGALAIIGYAKLRADAEVEAIVHEFQDRWLGAYWTPERRFVDAGYAGIAIPIDELEAPPFAIEGDLTLAQLLGYIGTWSAVERYREAHGQDPMRVLEANLSKVWTEPATARRIAWPLFVRAGRWRHQR